MRAIEERLRGLLARWPSLPHLLGLALILTAFYWPAVTMQGVFYVGDIFRLNYPARALYARALLSGRVPWWTPDALAGYPILAEGQTGAYYPPNLFLYRWLPLPTALNLSVLLSFWIAGGGLFMYARALGLRRGPAFLGACTFMLGGFLPAHLNHMNMVAAAAWLPWLLWAIERAAQAHRWRDWALAAAFFGLQGLAGHPQVMWLSAAPAAATALAGPLAGPRSALQPGRQLGQLAACCGALLLGAALGAAQLFPTLQLTILSQRAHPLTFDFFTSFSMPPADLLRLVRPFAGNPFPAVSQETVGYVGLLPLALAALAPLVRRGRLTAFWFLVAALGLSLVLGHFNPAYRLLWHVPLVNKFRVPARYLLWVDLSASVLAAAAADRLLAFTQPVVLRRQALAPGTALSLTALAVLWSAHTPLDHLLATWRWLPWVWMGLGVALLAALRWHPPARLWFALLVAVVVADLGAFVAVHNRTYNALMPPAEFQRIPDAARFLQADAGPGLLRVYTDEQVVPDLPVMRESLYPNTQLLYGIESANGYYPLVPDPQEWLRNSLSAHLLDLLNVRYLLVPQQLPAHGPTDVFIAEDRFARSLAGRSFDLAPQPVAALELEGFLLHTEGLTPGAPVAQVVVHGAEGEEAAWTLHLGAEISAWNDDGSDGPAVVRTWAMRFPGAPGGLGRTYLARHTLNEPIMATRVEVRALVPQGDLRVERLRLLDPAGGGQTLPASVGEGDHVLAYCSPGVAIYRNEGAGPRAFLAYRARVLPSDAEAYPLLVAPDFQPFQEVLLLDGPALDGASTAGDHVAIERYEPEYVRVRVVASTQAYLVLADSDYPGWQARVDGRPEPIHRADVALRAVLVGPGEHVVEFSFAPQGWYAAELATVAGWAALAGLAVLRR